MTLSTLAADKMIVFPPRTHVQTQIIVFSGC